MTQKPEVNMFKPFEIFFAKEYQSDGEAENTSENDVNKRDEARLKWANLPNKKMLKFIRKAEKKYDASTDENKQPFHSYLTYKELDLLLKSYDLPEKPPVNSKFYLINKSKLDFMNENKDSEQVSKKAIRDVKFEAAEKWKKMSEAEKNQLVEEHHNRMEDFNEKMFFFARNLPEQRIVDYQHYKSISIKKEVNNETHHKDAQKTGVQVKKENALKMFIPFEIYIEKNKDSLENPENSETKPKSAFEIRSLLRTKFTALSDKKKLKYIKKAEERYDSHDFDDNEFKPLLTSFLNKNEALILMNSYGMPPSVPSNLSAYFLKKSGISDMKEVFKGFRALSNEEKNQLISEHARDFEEYTIKTRKFLDTLPKQRLDDYSQMKMMKKVSKSKNSPNAVVKSAPNGARKRPAAKSPNLVDDDNSSNEAHVKLENAVENGDEEEGEDEEEPEPIKKKSKSK